MKAFFLSTILFTACLLAGFPQNSGLESITITGLESHMEYLASDELGGRGNGEPELMMAARYLASEANRMGLKAIDEDEDYLQYYPLNKITYDKNNSNIVMRKGNTLDTIDNKEFYLIMPQLPGNLHLSGEIVFAGYGIISEKNNYNDFRDIDVTGKILLIMNRAPMNKDGDMCRFDDKDWTNLQNIIYKYNNLTRLGAKAVFLVLDPKSGYASMDDIDPSFSRMFSTRFSKKAPAASGTNMQDNFLPAIIIHRHIADRILDGTGTSLQKLQEKIDRKLKPRSFIIPGKEIILTLNRDSEQLFLPNVVAMAEGSDPDLRHEAVVFMAHYDHLGKGPGGIVYNGADDNASGSVSLLEMAEAFMKEEQRPARSIVFIWVSGEEIGLYGSGHYAEYPLVPLENTVAVINLDMVGRTRTASDTGKIMGDDVSVLGGDTIGLIGGHQSKELLRLAEVIAGENGMICDYRYNDINHPQRLYYRSDHFSFAVHDIPVLFFSTGIHRDYHQATDTAEKIDYGKLLKVNRYVYLLGYRLADRPERIMVDNPFSTWQ